MNKMHRKSEKKKEEVAAAAKPAHVYGKWIYKTTASHIFMCECGNKYLKTRLGQLTCVRCMQKVLK